MKPECAQKLKEQFRSEQSAFHAYKAIADMTSDEYLQEALEEIMEDEYLHAKFVRMYLMEHDAYDPAQHTELEQTFHTMAEMY
jgi:rubrerythrin